jgi:nicotinamidase-related amidase
MSTSLSCRELSEGLLTDDELEVLRLAGMGGERRHGKRPALVVVDVTYGFCGDAPEPARSSVLRWPSSCGDVGWAAVERIRLLIDAARAQDVPVIYTVPMRQRKAAERGRWADKMGRRPEDLDKAYEILAEIAPADEAYVVHKPAPSGFYGSPLARLLTELGVDELVVCGGTTSGCVRSTVIDGFSHNLSMVVVRDAVFDRIEISAKTTLLDVSLKYGDVLDTADVIAEWACCRNTKVST